MIATIYLKLALWLLELSIRFMTQAQRWASWLRTQADRHMPAATDPGHPGSLFTFEGLTHIPWIHHHDRNHHTQLSRSRDNRHKERLWLVHR